MTSRDSEDVLGTAAAWRAAGETVALATVVETWGSSPRPAGSRMAVTASGRMAGSVSGGCIEGAVADAAKQTMATGAPQLLDFGISDERAWEVGLACGGTIKVLVEPAVRPEILDAARGPGGVVVATVVAGPGAGSALVVRDDGTATGTLGGGIDTDAVRAGARRALAREASAMADVPAAGGTAQVFLEVFPRQPTLLIFGGVHIAAALVPLAKLLGYRVVVADGREAFLGRERFPQADELVLAWPGEAFERVGIDPATYICVLSHDPKFDEPALEIALRSPAAYVGAIGSKKTQASRRERLRASGISPEQLARLRGPIGLDLGGRQPAETALAILAEMTAVRYGGTVRPLGEGAPAA